jgi:peptide/nickel transport system permease protein
MSDGEAYFDIVWRQFKKNWQAYFSMWFIVGLFLLAIFAPAIASNIPFVFRDGPKTIYPWWNALFHPAEIVDLVFNMALVAFAPWMLLALLTSWWGKRRGLSGRARLSLALVELGIAITALSFMTAVFDIRPPDPYAWRDFPQEQVDHPQLYSGIYPLLPFGPTEQYLSARVQPPGFRDTQPASKFNQQYRHWLGTADTGQDVLTQMIYGTRVSITIGLVAVSLYVTIGVVVGAVAGYFGGIVDLLVSRVIEIVQLFPSFFLILTLVGLIGPSIYIIMVVIGITGWPGIARLTRGEVLKQRSLDYTAAAQALGASHWRIIFRHILPNSLSPALVSIPFGISDAIVTEAGLSLLGFGIRPPAPSWGRLLNFASGDYHYWWLVVYPSLAIFLTVTTFNLVGNGLRDAMDPRLRH